MQFAVDDIISNTKYVHPYFHNLTGMDGNVTCERQLPAVV